MWQTNESRLQKEEKNLNVHSNENNRNSGKFRDNFTGIVLNSCMKQQVFSEPDECAKEVKEIIISCFINKCFLPKTRSLKSTNLIWKILNV